MGKQTLYGVGFCLTLLSFFLIVFHVGQLCSEGQPNIFSSPCYFLPLANMLFPIFALFPHFPTRNLTERTLKSVLVKLIPFSPSFLYFQHVRPCFRKIVRSIQYPLTSYFPCCVFLTTSEGASLRIALLWLFLTKTFSSEHGAGIRSQHPDTDPGFTGSLERVWCSIFLCHC